TYAFSAEAALQSRSVVFLPALLVLLLSARAQNNTAPSQTNTPALKTTTRAVVVDVVITGSNGEPIAGLQQKDFSLLEDGQIQTVNFFERHIFGNPNAATSLHLPPGVYSNEPTVAS